MVSVAMKTLGAYTSAMPVWDQKAREKAKRRAVKAAIRRRLVMSSTIS
jgi:hypothetical protein